MKIKSGVIEQFQQYSQFSNLEEFNIHMEKWCEKHKRNFTKGEFIGLMWLARFAAKVPGVANAKIGTVLKAIHEEYHGNGISRSTFKRMIGKAKKLGILTVYETSRNDGSQSSNLYVFNHFPTNELPDEEKLNQPNKTKYLLETIKNLFNKRKKRPSDIKADVKIEHTQQAISTTDKCTESKNEIQANEIDDRPSYWKLLDPNGEIKRKNPKLNQETNRQTEQLDYTYTSDHVPASFAKWVKIFFNNAKIIEEYWRMVLIAAYKNNVETKHEQVLNIAIDAFKQLIRKLKTTKEIKKPIAYFYGIVSKKFKDLYFEELYEMGFPVETPDTHFQDQSLSNLRTNLSFYEEPMCNPDGNSSHPEQQTGKKETILPFQKHQQTVLEFGSQAANRGKYYFAIFKELLES
ncbi:hypothetical protein [Calidifontibacillus erzurumensis]|uniref:hypothetical protein n=1 Tax=Calidifontibacillus erzurumensis TaxID=2741433 RepID=UPI0035B51B6E